MIDVRVRIHDKFSFEFKISFIAVPEKASANEHEFSIDTWIFVPNNLDINRTTYPKERFYGDVKSNIRLITPKYSLKDIYSGAGSPVNQLEASIRGLAVNPLISTAADDYSYQVKMFAAIFKSATRDKVYAIAEEPREENLRQEVSEYVADTKAILLRFRQLKPLLEQGGISESLRQYFSFGDDFMGNIVEQQTFLLMRLLKSRPVFPKIKEELYQLVKEENGYKSANGYALADVNDATNNFLVVMRRDILKKFIESDLYLITKNIKDGAIAEQFYYGLAAGVSMIFATIVAFTAQLRYGNFTIPLFFALVISYIFKDRIKELMRRYFSARLGRKYFDNKRELEIQGQNIGWTKEAFDFVTEGKVPGDVMNIRKRSPLVEAENKIYNEQIILYRKLVQLSSRYISEYKGYRFVGVNDITRFNLTHFVQKMDNPFVPLYIPDEQEGYTTCSSEKVYALYIVLRCRSSNSLFYRKFRLLFNREGIKEIGEIEG
jgi:hypothetical protein